MTTPKEYVSNIGDPLSNEQIARRLSFSDSLNDDLQSLSDPFDYFRTCRTSRSKQENMTFPQFMMPMPLHLRTFHGYNEEDGEKFLNDFIAFSTMSGFDDDRRMSAFSLYLAGPAYNWYKTLDSEIQRNWDFLKESFIENYATANDALLYSELQLYNELKLTEKMNVEDYHSEILKRGRKLKKTEPDMMSRFIDGLPGGLKFFVRAGRPTSLADAMQSARMGDACGYRKDMGPIAVPGKMETPTVCAIEKVQREDRLCKIEQQLEVVMQSLSKLRDGPVDSSPRARRECHKCDGKDHFKNRCKWNGQGVRSPDTKCQICTQNGHGAKECIDFQFPQGNDKTPGETRIRLGP
ncbi:hypothetical protein FSP39_010106 [Pinctada imbricata]|uniref:Retrotransposon gag domain-containing protein n=1 Tax=Pinctada imbricata TaxID=66713 RepID=A0AA89BHH0_PINIB|nr:hypothetical protein FSP39_010106 [Pinctada imbricata]